MTSLSISPEWVALMALAGAVFGLGVLLMRQTRRLDTVAASQRTLVRQLEAVHKAQLAYADATEEALTNLRDGLQTLTTVSANLDMKSYSMELHQARIAQRVKQLEKRRQDVVAPHAHRGSPSPVGTPAVKSSSAPSTPTTKTPPHASTATLPDEAGTRRAAAEQALIAAIHGRQTHAA